LKEERYDAIMLAAAGLTRLGLQHEIAEILSPHQICPAPGQGALAIQTREKDEAFQACAQLNHDPTSRAVICERAVLAELGGGCQLPIGVFAQEVEGFLRVRAVVVAPDGSRHIQSEARGESSHPERLAGIVASDLLARGARTILDESC